MTNPSSIAAVHDTTVIATVQPTHWSIRGETALAVSSGPCAGDDDFSGGWPLPGLRHSETVHRSGPASCPLTNRAPARCCWQHCRGRGGGLGALGSLAGGFLGEHPSTALFIDLLRSGTVSGHLIDRFDLRHVYHSRYNIDAAKHLAHVTKITDDKKSGVITIKVEDRDPVRARDLAQGYLDELNRLVTRTSTSAARQERIFIEQRLHNVQTDLEHAQIQLSEFSSKNSTVDIREQTRAMVEAGARVQGELLVEQSGLQSLRQIYGDGNIRVRETEARITSLPTRP